MSSSCIFSNAILSSRAKCECSKKECIAEKEFATCNSAKNLANCKIVYDFLRENSQFAVSGVGNNNLSVGQQNKIRIGGLFALNKLIYNNSNVENITTLIDKILLEYKELNNLPLQEIIPTIANFKLRRA